MFPQRHKFLMLLHVKKKKRPLLHQLCHVCKHSSLPRKCSKKGLDTRQFQQPLKTIVFSYLARSRLRPASPPRDLGTRLSRSYLESPAVHRRCTVTCVYCQTVEPSRRKVGTWRQSLCWLSYQVLTCNRRSAGRAEMPAATGWSNQPTAGLLLRRMAWEA